MVNITSYKQTTYNKEEHRFNGHTEGTCLSTDTKPTNWDGGSILLEIDTSKVYMYDAQNEQWREW